MAERRRDRAWGGAIASIVLLAVWIFGRAPEIEDVMPTPEEQLEQEVGRGGATPRQATP